MSSLNHRFETQCVHAGKDDAVGASNQPIQPSIVQSAVFDLGTTAEAEAIFAGARPGYAYSRFGNPTADTLARALAALEGGAGAFVTSSGNAAMMGAVTMAMDGRTGPLVMPGDIYGGSFELFRVLERVYRLPVQIVDSSDETAWMEAVGRAGAVVIESPSNPLMRLIDLEATVAAAREAGAPVIVDNTVATPFNQRPLELGVDWVVHSTTKYLNGHADVIGGAVISRAPLTSAQRSIHKNLGGTVNAFDAWLVLRGLRTFALRMAAHNANAERIVRWLQTRREVAHVYYPGLEPGRPAEVFRRQMKHGGGLLSFELEGGPAATAAFVDRLKLITHAVSLGGTESLITIPARSSHRGMSPEARRAAGVTDTLLRFAVGIEAGDDLIADLEQAFAGV